MFQRKNLEAIAILIGTIVGAGTFAIPSVVMKAGILPGIFYFLFLGAIALMMHLIYGEIVLRTSVVHRIVGYGEVYLGQLGKKILTLSSFVSLFGSNLIYLILGGGFLAAIFGNHGWGSIFYVAIFWFLLSLGIIFDWKRVSFIEFFMTVVLILVAVIIAVYCFSGFKSTNFSLINFSYLFLPWGAIFYAITGASAIPELKEVLGDKVKHLKSVIIWGTLVPLIIYIIFTISIVGASGLGTTEDTITGIQNLFGRGIIDLISVFGILSVATSYLVMGMVLKKIFVHDLKFQWWSSSIIVCLTPFVLYLLGLQNFGKIIAFLGLWLGAVEGILILFIHQRARQRGDRQPEYSLPLSKFFYYLMAMIFILGPVLTIIFKQL